MPEGQDATAPPAPPGDETTPAGDLGITVALEQFSGPMDLLLYLVRRAEVDIKDLPVTTIADQFAVWVSAAAGTTIDLEAAGDFVVMAATLLEIKARMVAPPPEGTEVADDGEDEFDPRAGLIRKLLIYRAAKEAAFDLDRREDQRRLRHHRGHREVVPDDAAEVDAWELKDVGAGTLANLWFDLLKRIDGLGPRTVLVDDMPMGVRMAQVVEDMRNRGEGRLSELFAIDSGPVARVGIVMAVLECTRQRQLRVNQAEQYGDVRIRFRAEDDRAITAGDPGPPEQLPKRQRRPPLVTWSGTPGQPESDDGETLEEPPENEEQRFLRELESTVGVERLLSRAADLEKGFIGWWEETHPGEPLPPGVVKPEPPPPPPPPPAPVVEAKPEAPPKAKRQPKPAAVPAAEAQVVAPTAETPAQPAPAVETAAVAPVADHPAAQVQPDAVAVLPVAPDPSPEQPVAPQPPAAAVAAVPDVPVAASPAAPDPTPAPVASAPDPQPVPASPASFEVVPLPSAPDQPQAQISASPPAPAAEMPTQQSPIEPDAEPELVASEPVTVEPEASVEAPTASVEAPVASVEAPVASVVAPAASVEPPTASVEAPATSVEPPATSVEAPAASDQRPAASVEPPAAEPQATSVVVPPPEPAPVPATIEPPVPVAAISRPPPDPDPDPPPPLPPATANTPPTPTTTTPTPSQPSKPTPMSRPRHLKLAALAALWALSIVGFVAWFQRPGMVLTASGPQDAVVARDGELAWTLNLALDPKAREDWLTPSASQPGSFAWRDERTCVFTPTGTLPAGAELVVTFDPKLRAYGGFHFDEKSVPSFRVRTLPALTVADPRGSLPAFGDGYIELALSRVPADPAVLLTAVAVSPAVPVVKTLVDGRLRLSGPFVPGTTYHLTVADTVPGKADDRPAAWQGDLAMPARMPGARLAAGTGRQAAIEAVNLPWLVVENAAGAREVVRFAPAVGDVPARAELPAWLLRSGENRLRLRWSGGEGEIALTRHDLPLTPDDAAPALLGGSLPVVSAH